MKSGEIGELALRRITGREGNTTLALSMKAIVTHLCALCCRGHAEGLFNIFKNNVADNEIMMVYYKW